MEAGKLRSRIRFQEPQEVRDAFAGTKLTWIDRGAAWAYVETIRGRETNVAHQIAAVTSLQVTTRRRCDVGPAWRIVFGCSVLSIEAVLPQTDNAFTVFLCSQGLNQGDN